VFLFAAPGQGAQTPGFLRPWLDVPGVADHLAWWSAVTGLDLVRYGTTADADEIRDTAVAQPLLVAAGLAAAAALDATPDATAGHSVGELVAAVIAGVLSPEAALVFVRERGRAMAEAAAVTETGMTAVLGGDATEVLTAIDKHGLTAANINGAGQVVAAGTMDRLAAFADEPPAQARLRPLQVAGAFHTEHMAPAADVLRRISAGMPVADPRTVLLSNRDGAAVTTGSDFVARLVGQVSAPVRWDACMDSMSQLGVTAVIELPPAGTLTGLARRALPDVERLALKTPDDLDKARALISTHAEMSLGQRSQQSTGGQQ
jgi:[acyl-carrier-protein] S-malonyltransferase